MPNNVRKVAHTGITVENLPNAVELWRDVLGFDLMGTAEVGGPFYAKVTGVPGVRISAALLTRGEHSVELLEYLAPTDRQTFRPRPCDVGSVHVALEVADIDKVVAACRAHGVLPVSDVQTVAEGSLEGTRIVYLHVPDGVTLELMSPPERADAEQGELSGEAP